MDGYCATTLAGGYSQLKGSHGFSITSLINPSLPSANNHTSSTAPTVDYSYGGYHPTTNHPLATNDSGCYDKYYDRTANYFPSRNSSTTHGGDLHLSHHPHVGSALASLGTDNFTASQLGSLGTAGDMTNGGSYSLHNKLDSLNSTESHDSSSVFSDPGDCDKDPEGSDVITAKNSTNSRLTGM